MRISVDDRFKPKLEAIADDLGIEPNKVINLILRQYLPIFEAHMTPGNTPQIPQNQPTLLEPPTLIDEPLSPIEFGEF